MGQQESRKLCRTEKREAGSTATFTVAGRAWPGYRHAGVAETLKETANTSLLLCQDLKIHSLCVCVCARDRCTYPVG